MIIQGFLNNVSITQRKDNDGKEQFDKEGKPLMQRRALIVDCDDDGTGGAVPISFTEEHEQILLQNVQKPVVVRFCQKPWSVGGRKGKYFSFVEIVSDKKQLKAVND